MATVTAGTGSDTIWSMSKLQIRSIEPPLDDPETTDAAIDVLKSMEAMGLLPDDVDELTLEVIRAVATRAAADSPIPTSAARVATARSTSSVSSSTSSGSRPIASIDLSTSMAASVVSGSSSGGSMERIWSLLMLQILSVCAPAVIVAIGRRYRRAPTWTIRERLDPHAPCGPSRRELRLVR